jgi:hypothetical protein
LAAFGVDGAATPLANVTGRTNAIELTKRGRSRLDVEVNAWRKLSGIVAQILERV